MEPTTWALLLVAALFAGFIDSIVGGGGIITLPALLAAGVPPHLAVGTNKVVGTGASAVATWQYAKHGLIERAVALAAFPAALLAGAGGAMVILQVPETWVMLAVSVVMILMVTWILLRPKFGQNTEPVEVTRNILFLVVGLALTVGFYDGLLGPGTGSFLLFGLVSLAGMPFLQAASNGRLLNFGSNVGALIYFAAVGNVDWVIGGIMAIGTVTGGYFGSRSGIKHGARWIRPLFVAVAVALLVRLFWPGA